MAKEFIILDDGETLITGEWIPDPEVVAAKLVELSNKIDDTIPVMMAMREVIIESTERHFDTKIDAEGRRWPPLSDDYATEKEREGYDPSDILVRTGAGKAAATSEDSYMISEDAIWFDPTALPDYMRYHQSGAPPYLPKREFIGLSVADDMRMEAIYNAWFAETLASEFPSTGYGYNVLGEFPVVGFTTRGQPLVRTRSGIRFGRKS